MLCEKQGKINEAYKKLQDGWLNNGDKVPPAEFAKVVNWYIGDIVYICFEMLFSRHIFQYHQAKFRAEGEIYETGSFADKTEYHSNLHLAPTFFRLSWVTLF